jgi:subtilisin family serine protease
MKRGIFILLLFVIGSVTLLGEIAAFDLENFQPNIIIVGFEQEFIGNEDGILDFELDNGLVKTGDDQFDQLANDLKIVDMTRFIRSVRYKDWNENGVYIQNIFRIHLKDNANIEFALDLLSKNSNVIYAEYEAINRIRYTPDDPQYPQQWHLPQIECPDAWDWTFGSHDVLIGIVDSGVYWTHEDLQENIWVNEAELNSTTYGGNTMTINWETGAISGGNGYDDDGNGEIDDCLGWNHVYNNNQSYQSNPGNDHGTHVAGCAAAVGDNGIGVSGSSMTASILVSTHRGSVAGSTISNGYDGIMYCADTGADIINCSWGGPGNATTANYVVNYATDQGALVVGSAGNDTWSNDVHPSYPNDCTNALCVAATDQADEITYFSNWGTAIDVSAPGVNIKSTVIDGSGYASYQGTSMSSPIVSGLAALVMSVHPELCGLELKARLEMTTDDINDINPDYAGLLGTGRVNAYQAAMYDLVPNLTIENFNFYENEGDGDGEPNPGELCNLEINIWNNWFSGGLWAQADDVTVMFSTTEPEVTFVDGSDSFNVPVIYQAGSHWNTDAPVMITTPEDTNVQDIPITVTITANPDGEFPYIVTHELVISLSYTQSGWPLDLGGATNSSAALTDIDNDGEKEAIFGDFNGLLHALNPDASESAPFPIDLGGIISAAVAVADIDDDNNPDMVVTNEAGHIYAVNNQGSLIFSYATGSQIKGTPMIVDVNGDGALEIVAFTFVPSAQVFVLNADGTDFANFPATLSSTGILSSPAAVDLDGDGNLELLASSISGTLYAISSATGSDIAGWPVDVASNSYQGPTVANIDADPEPEVIIGISNGNLMAFNHDGSNLFMRDFGCVLKGGIVVADIDANGSNDIIFVGNSGDLYVVDNTGTEIGAFPVDVEESVDSTPILADLDGNGTLEIIFGDNAGYLHAYDVTGVEADNFPIDLGNSLRISPSIADLDVDGDAEIVLPNQYGYYAIDYSGAVPNDRIAWGSFKRNLRRTNNALDPTTGSSDTDTPDLITSLGNNYPNPFNPTTKINFTLKQDGFTELSIYNLKGQLVRTLHSDHLNSGVHFLEWDGRDDSGRSASTGIYFYKLQTVDFVAAKKMIMMK